MYDDLHTLYTDLATKNVLKVADSFNDFIAGILAAALQVAHQQRAKADSANRLVKLPSEL